MVNIFLKTDLLNAANLKAKCLSFIVSNSNQVSLTKEWEQMVKSGGQIMVDVCRVLMGNANNCKRHSLKRSLEP